MSIGQVGVMQQSCGIPYHYCVKQYCVLAKQSPFFLKKGAVWMADYELRDHEDHWFKWLILYGYQLSEVIGGGIKTTIFLLLMPLFHFSPPQHQRFLAQGTKVIWETENCLWVIYWAEEYPSTWIQAYHSPELSSGIRIESQS